MKQAYNVDGEWSKRNKTTSNSIHFIEEVTETYLKKGNNMQTTRQKIFDISYYKVKCAKCEAKSKPNQDSKKI